MTRAQLLAALLAVAVAVWVVDLVRRRRLSEEYSLLSLVAVCGVLVLAFWTKGVTWLTHRFGALYETSVIFFFGLVFAFLALVYYATKLTALTQELSARIDRLTVIRTAMLLSFVAAVVCGAVTGLPWTAVLVVACLYSGLVSADSATLTSGIVAVSPPESRGTAMAVYSMVGFAAASAGAFAIGGLLDALGGESPRNWILAFAAIGASNLVGLAALRDTRNA